MQNKISLFSKSRYLPMVCLILLLVITSYFYYQKTFSFHFVDEEDNFVLGMYLNQGEKLYKDLFSHHQPLAYIFSAKIQQILPYENIYQLIETHRLFIIGWSFIWLFLITLRFGWVGFLFSFFYEISKIYLLGNLFLSESLVIYPIIYLVIWCFQNDKTSKLEYAFLGICLSLGFLLLAPIWPLLVFIGLYILVKTNFDKQKLFTLFMGLLPIILISIFYSDLNSYFYYVFYINYNYYLPFSDNSISTINLIKSFFTPLVSFFSTNQTTQTGYLIKIFSLILIIEYFLLFKYKKYSLVFFSFLILGLSNIRYISPGSQEFIGFHLIVWYANLIIITLVLFKEIYIKERKVGYFLISLFILAGIMSLSYGNSSLFKIGDKQKETYINYSRQYDYGQAIKEISSPKDTIFVVPDEWLIYSQSRVQNASYMVNYYAWMTYVPSIKYDINRMFLENPPTFWYCDCDLGYFGLEKYFSKYTRLKKEQGSSKLYVLPKKLETLTTEQKNKLKFFGFSYE